MVYESCTKNAVKKINEKTLELDSDTNLTVVDDGTSKKWGYTSQHQNWSIFEDSWYAYRQAKAEELNIKI